jgi:transcriptional regulator with XRE-family HTH domain
MTIAEALDTSLKKAGWSLAQAAVAAEVGEATVRRWARGERGMPAAACEKLRKTLPGFADLLDQRAVA